MKKKVPVKGRTESQSPPEGLEDIWSWSPEFSIWTSNAVPAGVADRFAKTHWTKPRKVEGFEGRWYERPIRFVGSFRVKGDTETVFWLFEKDDQWRVSVLPVASRRIFVSETPRDG